MSATPFALYDAFSDSPFGGSQAGIVSDASALDLDTKRRIVQEMGLPAIGFVTATGERSISAQFQSTVMELPMCGHGTIAMMTRMVELGVLDWSGSDRIDADLQLPTGVAAVTIRRREDGRPLVMLEVRPPSFRRDDLDTAELARRLGLETEDFSETWPIETGHGDFVHLVVPIRDLAAMRRIVPDFGGLVRFSRDHGIETFALFCTEVEQPESTLHVRDFCPAVGVAESAAAGTTNAALTGYLVRHGIVRPNGDSQVAVRAEQGHEINRPSSILSVASLDRDAIVQLQVGGVATKVADGHLHLQ